MSVEAELGQASNASGDLVLQVSDLHVAYDTEKGALDTVRHVSLHIGPGETYGLVGESGSGKTTIARAVVRNLATNGRVVGGTVRLSGASLLDLPKQRMREIWGSRIAMVHQDPAESLNPSLRVGEQIAEVARAHLGMGRREAWQKAIDMLAQVGMPDPRSVSRRYPHQLSGGVQQRVLIAAALVTNPELLILDEPTTALDVTTEAVILDLLRELMEDYQTSVLYITHNLGVVARTCDRVGVLYAGELLEEGPIQRVFNSPLHPYTQGLLDSVPRVDTGRMDVALHTIPGSIPRPGELPHGCVFAPRCVMARDRCGQEQPPLQQAAKDHLTACLYWSDMERGDKPASTARKRLSAGTKPGHPLLEAKGIKKYFGSSTPSLLPGTRGDKMVKAVDDISIAIQTGSTVGIVGESGCGKTTFARCIVGLEHATAGEVELEGQLLPKGVDQRPRSALRRLQMVFQNPESSLNPQLTVGSSIGRPLELFEGVPKNQIKERVTGLLEAVHLSSAYYDRLPHELSGGEKQRVAIARALAADPSLMICDEPISSLDVSVQASLLNLLVELQAEQETAYLFISHDLAAVRYISNWIAVVYLGRLWEEGEASRVFAPPYHPYTEALISAMPIPDPEIQQERIRLSGRVPSAMEIPPGCRFHPRCPRKLGEICEQVEPPWQEIDEFHRIRCHIPAPELAVVQKSLLKTGKESGSQRDQ